MAQKLTLANIKCDALKYIAAHRITRTELSYLIGCEKSNLYLFLNVPERGLNTRSFINLLNLLYYDNETESRL